MHNKFILTTGNTILFILLLNSDSIIIQANHILTLQIPTAPKNGVFKNFNFKFEIEIET